MRKAFVLGHPIKHSRSPLIHGYWLDKYGIDGTYEAIDVLPEDLPAFFDRIRAGEFVGGNCTVPLKEIAYGLVDSRDAETDIGATNTLSTYRTSAGIAIHGQNTDVYGFLANLDQQRPGWDVGLGEVIVLGAGGAARGIVAALELRSAGAIHVLNRTREKAARLAELSQKVIPGTPDEFGPLARFANLVINTTTVGMHGTRFEGLPLDRLSKDCIVTDIVYTPLETPLLADARGLGLETVDGLGMLLQQATPGFEAWFGVKPEVTAELRQRIEATL